MLSSLAVVLEQPKRVSLERLPLDKPAAGDVTVETLWSGVSAGTERLLFEGRMPAFPGMGYPLVPGYESVGRVVDAGPEAKIAIGTQVFVPGAKCFGDSVRCVHGGAASLLVAPASRVVPVPAGLSENAVLLALAATALHALGGSALEGVLIVGHGVLGRLLARLVIASGGEPPVVWEANSLRAGGAVGYEVTSSDADARKDYRTIFDVSGDPAILDPLVQRLARGGEIVLAGFYDRLSLSFPPAFMREARIRVAAIWRDGDLARIVKLVEAGTLSLDGLLTHRSPAADASSAYPIAFDDPTCLKMVLDWSARS
jgi:3-hydroxyethyl bacteriochlorophyllide a dehydrogenase